MSELRFVERVDPDAVFTALSDDNRVAILQTLWESDEDAVPFSDLREAVGIEDSGQFNYHLDKLVDRFVTRTENGYRLSQAGKRINGAIEAGAYTVEASFDPILLDEGCPVCGETRTLRYEDETVTVECESCPVTARFGVPPSVFIDCDRAAIPRVASRYLRTIFRHLSDGFCAYCDGPVRPAIGSFLGDDAPESIPDDFPGEFSADVDDLPVVEYDCRRCGATATSAMSLAFLDHPAVVSFYHDNGIDVRAQSVWDFTAFDTDSERIRTRDPLRASVTYGIDADELTLVVDADLEVVEVER